MTLKEKDLLLEDLCSRLLYGVKFMIDEMYLTEDMINAGYNKIQELYGITCEGNVELLNMDYHMPVESIKPYLFPLSSMSEEQRKEFLEISHLENRSFYNREEIVIVSNEVWTFDLGGDVDTEYRSIDIKRTRETVKWLDKNYFDWRGLIPMGLAEDATNLNIY